MRDLLFPSSPRDFPGRRAVRVTLRALHVLAAGSLTGAVLAQGAGALISTLTILTALSGMLLLLNDLYASCAVLLELRGLVIALKLAALWAAMRWPQLAGAILCVTMIVGVVSSHMPARFRHRLWLPGVEVSSDTTKG